MWQLPKLACGDRVRVRSKEQILATLDADGAVDGMPFMPEMFQFCGRELTVAAVAHKTCDTANRTGGRKLDRTVHLAESRCDGRAHGGCDADCNLFWKEVWLERIDGAGRITPSRPHPSGPGSGRCTETRVMQCARADGSEEGGVRYRCQATQLFAASRPLAWWNIRQYVLDVRTGNARAPEVLRVLWLAFVYHLRALPLGYRLWCAFYEWMHHKLTGRAGPFFAGTIKTGEPTPADALDLVPGEEVCVKSAAEIAATLNTNNKNRGIWFGPEQVPYCGGTFKVRRRVAQIIDERTGEMIPMKTPCITLENALCRGHYSTGRMFCPRLITPYWRELWLERVKSSDG
jgi:hypothetical protein